MRYKNNDSVMLSVNNLDLDAACKAQLTAEQQKEHEACIKLCLATLRIAFPTQVRNYSEEEYRLMFDLWSILFTGVNPQVLQKAVIQFITHDRKGFYPSPGQVMQHVERITADLLAEQKQKEYTQSIVRLKAHNQRISNGENCGTCRFGEYVEGRLFCVNPSSYYYKGDDEYKIGTTDSKLCDLYEPTQTQDGGAD